MVSTLLPLILLLPFAGFLVNGLLGKKIGNEKAIGTIGTAAVAIPFLFAVVLFFQMLGAPSEERAWNVTIASWIAAGRFSVDFSYQLDQLSMIFLLIVTGVGSLIHLYSIGYMHGDRGFFRFFAYLNLFIFMMLNLVLADNFLVTFLGWEGVGLCSFLLIGFWYDREFEGVSIRWTGDAAKKAFVMNRIGDLGMIVGTFILFSAAGSLKYGAVEAAAVGGSISSEMLTIATLCLFLGACGKSAQIPLSVWLPDAMAGPTPVSALIHAATMVTSGIFLVSRNATIFSMSHTTMAVITGIAVATALIAATVGLVQNDIKKVLAYSTVSQLGFMFVALGVGAFTAAVFHVMTHAFFKALLFLGSGSVIHGMHEEQDMQKMGGLRAYMPQTYRTYFIGALAISGVPILSGFFSKDEILAHAFVSSPIVWGLGALAALCTAFYMFRSVYLTFWGKERFDHHHLHPHESPAVMTIPLWILAFLSIFGGFLGLPMVVMEEWFGVHHANALHTWLEPVFAGAAANLHGAHLTATTEGALMVASTLIALFGIWLAYRFYVQRPELPGKLAASFRGVHKLLWNKWYVDEVYEGAVVKPTWFASREVLLKIVDKGTIDGFLHTLASGTGSAASVFRRLQTGVAQHYMTVFIVGIIAIVGWLIFG